jgi:translation initiation factor 3 subunit F
MATPLFIEGAMPKVRVLPVVYFSILDHYMRRNSAQTRVIGVLLGTVMGKTVEVTNCFPVPHNETEEQVVVDVEYQSNMRALYQMVNPNEVVVGWYATGSEVTEHSLVIHDVVTEDAQMPVHLCVDTNLEGGKMGIRALVSEDIGVPSATRGKVFVPVECEVLVHEPERLVLSLLDKSMDDGRETVPLVSDLDHVATSTAKLQEMIARALEYVNKVLSGEVEADERIGRYLRDTVAAVPKVDAVRFASSFHDSVQDLLMLEFLSNLAQSQVAVQHKLSYLL